LITKEFIKEKINSEYSIHGPKKKIAAWYQDLSIWEGMGKEVHLVRRNRKTTEEARVMTPLGKRGGTEVIGNGGKILSL